MSLVRNGRARLALALPHHREQLRIVKSLELDALFEAYAIAAMTLENLRKENPPREDVMLEYQGLCLDMQAEAVQLLERHGRERK